MNGVEITDKRLIGVLFNELSFLEHSVIFSFTNTEKIHTSRILTAPKIDSTDPRNPKIQISDPMVSSEQYLELEFILNGKRFLAKIIRMQDGAYTLPEKLIIEDRRDEERKQFRSHKGCEIIWNSKKILGTPLDLNSNFFSCQISAHDGQELRFSEKRDATIVVYGTEKESGLTFTNVEIVSFREQKNSDYLLVFKISANGKTTRGSRSAPREELKGKKTSPLISLESGEQISPTIKILGNIISLSLSGFAFSPIGSNQIPVSGLLYSCPELQVSFRFVRSIDESTYAFSFVYRTEADDLKWTQFLEQHTDLLSVRQINAEKIGKFLVECGFIRGQRREYYGENPSLFLVDNWLNDSGLFRRYVEYTDNNAVSGQCSAVRISTAAWLIQEAGTGIFKQSDFRELLTRTLIQMKAERESGIIEARSFVTIYDPNLKPPKLFWDQTISDKGEFYRCWHTLKATASENKNENLISTFKTLRLEETNITNLINSIPTSILKSFGFLELNLEISNTNNQLNALSSTYGVRARVLEEKKTGKIAAIAFYYHGPYTLNVSGLVNSIFIFPTPDFRKTNLKEVLDSVVQIEEFNSTRDILLVFNQNDESIDPRIIVDKKFIMAVDDLTCYLAKMEANKSVA